MVKKMDKKKKVYTQPILKVLAPIADMTMANDLVNAHDGLPGSGTKGSS